MRKLLLHAGLHKTGSTWLQRNIFPYWEEIEYIADSVNYTGPDSSHGKPLVISAESMCGNPYPISQGFDPTVISENIKKYNATHVLIFEREFHSWCLSVYQQTLHEGHYWSLERFLRLNEGLSDWRNVGVRVGKVCEALDVRFMCLSYSEIKKDPQSVVRQIADFLDVNALVDIDLSARNTSRYGVVYVNTFRLLNFLFRGKIRHKLGIRPMLQRGFVGYVLDYLSPRRLDPIFIKNFFDESD